MNLSKKEKIIIILAVISLILLVIIFKWINYLSVNDYIYYESIEGFDKNYVSSGYTNTVNLPLNTTYSCKNMCGPTSRCAITGHQCLSDIDCPGCQPYTYTYTPPLNKSKFVPGDNDSGKLTVGVTPTYSTLTTDIGTESAIYKSKYNKSKRTPQLTGNGENTWRDKYNYSKKIFDLKFVPPQLPNMPFYSNRYSVTGEFIDTGPLASNS